MIDILISGLGLVLLIYVVMTLIALATLLIINVSMDVIYDVITKVRQLKEGKKQ